MGVEPGRDEEEVGREIVERRQDARLVSVTQLIAPVPGLSGALQILPTPVSLARSGSRIERHLMGRAVEEVLIGPECSCVPLP